MDMWKLPYSYQPEAEAAEYGAGYGRLPGLLKRGTIEKKLNM
jgi:hypothetical protein